MRIAMFSETFLPGTDGVVTRLCGTLKHLEDAGHDVLLFAPKELRQRLHLPRLSEFLPSVLLFIRKRNSHYPYHGSEKF